MSAATKRQTFRGIAGSWGIGCAPVTLLDSSGPSIPRKVVQEGEVAHELERLHEAIRLSRDELESLRNSLRNEDNNDYHLILDAHLMMHRDELLVNRAEQRIREERVNAEWALRRTINELRARLAQASAPYFRERAQDVEQVGRHILRAFFGGRDTLPPIRHSTVVVARDLSPGEVAKLAQAPLAGVVTALGSATSHTAIFARALGIPAVVGVADIHRLVDGGECLIVDAFDGLVVLHPSADEQHRARARASRYRQFTGNLQAQRNVPTRTRDGFDVELFANVELPVEIPAVAQESLSGIGLFRTEFLFLYREHTPNEDRQVEIYREALEQLAPRPVIFRTADLGDEKSADKSTYNQEDLGHARNPALGLRAIRLSLQRLESFHIQLRALLRAAAHAPKGQVRVMFPLISSFGELVLAKQQLTACKRQLESRGVASGDVQIGTMLEVPSAVLTAEVLAREVDFFSVGTNDLLQYTLAVDRSNPEVAHLAKPLHPALLRLLSLSNQAAQKARIECMLCGDMAADLLALPLLLGFGFRGFSLPVGVIPVIRECIRRTRTDKAQRIAKRALTLDTADQVEDSVRESLQEELGDLWQEYRPLFGNDTVPESVRETDAVAVSDSVVGATS